MINQKLEVEYINAEAFKRFAGYEKEDVIGKKTSNFMHPDDAGKGLEALVQGQKIGIGTLELRLKHKDDLYYWYEATGQIFKDKDDKYKGIIIMRNVSDRKLAEEKLKESEERYRLITENANDLIGILNEKMQLEFVNEVACRNVMGYKVEEVIGFTALDLVHPDDLKQANKALRKGFRTGEGSIESRLKHKDGHYVWLELKGTTFYDAKHALKGLLIAREISERRKAEDDLRISEQKYRNILDNLNDLIYVINKNLEFEYINEPIFNKLLGYKKEDTLERKPLDVIHPDDMEKCIKALRNGFKDREGKIELRVRDINGTYHLHELKGKIFIDVDAQEKAMIISRDITAEKEALEKLKDSEERYRLITENAYDLITVIDQNYKMEFINEKPLKHIKFGNLMPAMKNFQFCNIRQ